MGLALDARGAPGTRRTAVRAIFAGVAMALLLIDTPAASATVAVRQVLAGVHIVAP